MCICLRVCVCVCVCVCVPKLAVLGAKLAVLVGKLALLAISGPNFVVLRANLGTSGINLTVLSWQQLDVLQTANCKNTVFSSSLAAFFIVFFRLGAVVALASASGSLGNDLSQSRKSQSKARPTRPANTFSKDKPSPQRWRLHSELISVIALRRKARQKTHPQKYTAIGTGRRPKEVEPAPKRPAPSPGKKRDWREKAPPNRRNPLQNRWHASLKLSRDCCGKASSASHAQLAPIPRHAAHGLKNKPR